MPNLRCVVYSISEDRIINNNYIIITENLPIQGLDPDLKVYGEYYLNQEPPYDSRSQTLNIVKTRVESSHPTYGAQDPNLLTYEINHQVIVKSQSDLYLAVDQAQQNANNLLDFNEGITEAIKHRNQKILHKKIQQLPLAQWEDDLNDLMDNVADAKDENSDNADLIKDFIQNNPNQIPDLDSGWKTSLP